ncbi:MAG: hypothetical protein L6R42_000111 [Xanthoria sp. 1 TBL-2021]|nr:MAG: hypothetical protein L6R42_000111 [Xanthoria sp. 1 TBL-2021]
MDAGQGENPDCMGTVCDISGLVGLHNPSGYIIMELPSCNSGSIQIAEPSGSASNTKTTLALAQSSSLPQILIAILQIGYASYTLAKSTGDEIERNSYTSFNLTVIPYIIMSFVNLLGNLATPIYPCVYLVATSTMYEARQRGNVISGYTGYIPDEHLRTVTGFEDLQIQPVNCRTTDYQHQHASQNPTSTRQKSVKVCFDKNCPYKDSHQTITVASGKPLEAPTSRVAEVIFKCFLGLPCIIATPIIVLIYVSKRNPINALLQTKVPVLLWYAVGDLIGILLLYYRDKVNISFLLADTKIMLSVLSSMFFGSRPGQKRTYEKRREHMQGRWIKLSLLVCGFVGGLGVAGWNFWHVAVELIQFGNCRALD